MKIPNLSPNFDEEFYTNGKINEAIDYVIEFYKSLNIEGLSHKLTMVEGKPPLLILIYEGSHAGSKTVMTYGHLDKQPHFDGWIEGTGPTTPTIIDGRLYGRGAADDGYSVFLTLLAIKTVLDNGGSVPRMVLVSECEEESGSHYLLDLLEMNKDVIGKPDVCLGLDSRILDKNNIWISSTL